MGKLVRLWNPRIDHRLGRHWVRFDEPIMVGGSNPGQSGMLTLGRPGSERMRARLEVLGREFEQEIVPGSDIELWINGLRMLVGVTAIDDERALVAFGIPRGSKVNVTLGCVTGTRGSVAGLGQLPG